MATTKKFLREWFEEGMIKEALKGYEGLPNIQVVRDSIVQEVLSIINDKKANDEKGEIKS